MSIANEIQRLNKAKEDIKNSIEGKGVSVPSDASISDYFTYIDNIQGGGGQSFKYVDNVEFDDYGRMTRMRFTGNEVPASGYMTSYLEEVELADNVASIGNSAFRDSSCLTSINIPDNITSISNNVFYGCSGLTSINIPDSVTNIGTNAFYNCIRLASIDIPDGVTEIGSYAFQNCSGLISITILSVTPPTLASNVFTGTSMCPIYVPEGSVNAYKSTSNLSNWRNRIVPIGWEYDYSSGTEFRYTGDTGTTEFTHINNDVITSGDVRTKTHSSLSFAYIGDNVTEIAEKAFSGCLNITFVGFSDNSSLQTIGSSAFTSCNRLKSITIPDSIITISKSAFVNCSRLESVYIGTGVTSIDYRAFGECSILTSVAILAITPPTLGEEAFMNTNDCPIYVPDTSVDTYKSEPTWSDYADRIKPLSEKP